MARQKQTSIRHYDQSHEKKLKQKQMKIVKNKEPKRRRRYRPGTVALRQIRRYQSGGELLVAKMPFRRLVREITIANAPQGLRYQDSALMALQEATEQYLVSLFQDSYLCSLHGGRVTLTVKDMVLAKKIRGDAVKFSC